MLACECEKIAIYLWQALALGMRESHCTGRNNAMGMQLVACQIISTNPHNTPSLICLKGGEIV